MNIMKKYLIYFLVLLLSGFLNLTLDTVYSATYYVKKTGNNSNNCTQAQNPNTPKLTINAAFNCLNGGIGNGAGHIIEVWVGEYNETLDSNVNQWPSGIINNYFTLRVHSGDIVTIKANAEQNIRIFNDSNPNFYVTIDGFKFDGINTSGLAQIGMGSCCSGPSFVRFINNEIINSPSHGILGGGGGTAAPSNNFEIINNKVHDGAFDCSGGLGGEYCYPIYWTGNFVLIEGNEIYNHKTYGIHLYDHGRPHDGIVRKNYVHDFPAPIDDNRGQGILTDGQNHQVYDNIIANGARGIICYDASLNCKVWNNTIFNMAFVGITYNSTTNTQIKNNINYNLSASVGNWLRSGNSGNVESNNLSNLAATGVSVVADPLFVNSGAGDFGLQINSPAINAGTTSGLTQLFNSTNPEIGALELFGTVNPTGIVGNIANNILEITLPDNTSSGPLPLTTCTGFSVSIGGRTIINCSVVSGKVRLTLSSNVNSGESGTWSYTPGNVTNSINIGNNKNQRLNTIAATNITNQVQGSPSTRNMSLTWQDLSNNETGFRIYRANQVNGIVGVFSFLNSVNPGVVSYTDSNTVGEFCYRITSFNTGGESNPSNIVCSASIITPPMVSIPNSPGGLQLVIK